MHLGIIRYHGSENYLQVPIVKKEKKSQNSGVLILWTTGTWPLTILEVKICTKTFILKIIEFY